MLDGAVNIDPDYSSLNYSPSIDSVAEFQVQTAMVSAEYGRAAVNVVTRSGTDQFHGGAWEFLRNRAFDARPFNLNSDLPQFQRALAQQDLSLAMAIGDPTKGTLRQDANASATIPTPPAPLPVPMDGSKPPSSEPAAPSAEPAVPSQPAVPQ